jgi:sugar phosphate isomerase/epimerase
MREVGEIVRQFCLTAMVEFVRASSFISTLPTLLKMTREAGHSNLRPMLDCYHFWSGLSKFEDLDLIQPGELAHVHFQDVLDMPRELLDNTTRFIPGDGIAPSSGYFASYQKRDTRVRYRLSCSCPSFNRRTRTNWRAAFASGPSR